MVWNDGKVTKKRPCSHMDPDKHRFPNKSRGELQAAGCSLSLGCEQLNYRTQAELQANVETDS